MAAAGQRAVEAKAAGAVVTWAGWVATMAVRVEKAEMVEATESQVRMGVLEGSTAKDRR